MVCGEKISGKIYEVGDEDPVIIAGDLNAHVGNNRRSYEEVMGEFGFGERNQEGEDLLQLCIQNNSLV